MASIEAAVDERLDPGPDRAEERRDGEGGAGDGEIVAAGEAAEHRLEPDDDAEVEAGEKRRDTAVDECLADDDVDVPELVPYDGDAGGDRDPGDRENQDGPAPVGVNRESDHKEQDADCERADDEAQLLALAARCSPQAHDE